MIVACVLVFATSVLAAPPFTAKYKVMYDAYVQAYEGAWLADTLIVVTNGKNTKPMKVWIEVYDKHGVFQNEATLINGGQLLPGNAIPPNGFGWITIGALLNRNTFDPFGHEGLAEKFTFKVSTSRKDMPPIIEVKQVIFEPAVSDPTQAIWNGPSIKTWCETALGGLNSVGVIKTQFGPPQVP